MGKQLDKLQGKKVVVIGGSSGMGLGAAGLLLEAGANVHIVSSNTQRVQDAISSLGHPHIYGHVGDVRDEEGFTALLVGLAPIDHIIFSAVDMVVRGALADADLEEGKYLSGVKLWGPILVGKVLAKHDIVARGGSLTLTSGRAALYPGMGAVIGGALNGAVYSLTRGLAVELAEKQIRVNTVVPGLVKTNLWDKLGTSKEEQADLFRSHSQSISVGFAAEPHDIAEAYLYAIRADYANGTAIRIDGGESIRQHA